MDTLAFDLGQSPRRPRCSEQVSELLLKLSLLESEKRMGCPALASATHPADSKQAAVLDVIHDVINTIQSCSTG